MSTREIESQFRKTLTRISQIWPTQVSPGPSRLRVNWIKNHLFWIYLSVRRSLVPATYSYKYGPSGFPDRSRHPVAVRLSIYASTMQRTIIDHVILATGSTTLSAYECYDQFLTAESVCDDYFITPIKFDITSRSVISDGASQRSSFMR